MIQFDRLEIRNFLSFKHANFNLGDHKFLLILGENLDSESSSSNGAGKSALLEGLVWCLFGRTLRNLTFDEVVNSQSKGDCSVGSHFSENGNKYFVQRFRKSSKFGNVLELYLNDKRITGASSKETQEKLEKVLGMNFDIFMNSVAFPQGSARFFATLTDAEQKTLLEKMLNLEVLSEAQGRIKQSLKKLELSAIQIQAELSSLQAQKATLEEQETELERNRLSFEGARQQKIHQFVEEIKMQKGKGEKLSSYKASILRQQHALKVKANQLSEELETKSSKEGELAKVQSSFFRIEAKTEQLQEKQREVNQRLQVASSLEGKPVCPTCGQSISGELVDEQIEGLNSELSELRLEFDTILERKEKRSLQMRELKGEIAQLQRVELELKGLKDRLDRSKEEMWSHEKEVSLAKERELQLRNQAYQLKSEVNPYLEPLDNSKKSLKRLSGGSDELKKQQQSLTTEGKYLEFWEEGFGNRGLKSFILDSVVPILTQKTNEYLNILSDGTLRAGFHTQTELKSGEQREKFGIDVWTQDGADRYLGLSGGEQKRLNLAILMALKHLAQMQTAGKCDLLLADELFDALDLPGIERAVQLLQQQRKVGHKVFVISHSEELREYFDDVLVVQKKDGISRLEK